jgi:hypothetical protein
VQSWVCPPLLQCAAPGEQHSGYEAALRVRLGKVCADCGKGGRQGIRGERLVWGLDKGVGKGGG